MRGCVTQTQIFRQKHLWKSADVKLCKLTWNRSKNGVNFQASNPSSLETTFEYKYTCIFLDLFQCKISIDILCRKLIWLFLGSVQVNRSFKSFSGQKWSFWSFGGRCESAILGRLFGAQSGIYATFGGQNAKSLWIDSKLEIHSRRREFSGHASIQIFKCKFWRNYSSKRRNQIIEWMLWFHDFF